MTTTTHSQLEHLRPGAADAGTPPVCVAVQPSAYELQQPVPGQTEF
ncbi:hypothetical protein [Planctomicrobium piriforme]|nr:hypothetical protein [Planctomicrobium piriforme]